MRAIFYKKLKEDDSSLIVEGDEARHLIKAVRIREGEEILILNGAGLVAEARVLKVGKKEAEVEIIKLEKSVNPHQIHLALGLPKRDAFEDILRSSVELGVSRLYFWKSDFSQHDYKENDRYQRILESALIQSNNPYLPELTHFKTEEELRQLVESYSEAIYFCSHQIEKQELKKDKQDEPLLIIIGPEGGFSEREEQMLAESKKTYSIHLPTAIMRAPTAVAAGVGYVLGFKQ